MSKPIANVIVLNVLRSNRDYALEPIGEHEWLSREKSSEGSYGPKIKIWQENVLF